MLGKRGVFSMILLYIFSETLKQHDFYAFSRYVSDENNVCGFTLSLYPHQAS